MNETEITIILKSLALKDNLKRLINLVQNNQPFFGNPPAGESCVKVATDKLEELVKETAVPIKNLKTLRWKPQPAFDCPCGNREIVISDESGDKTCGTCGRVFRFTAKLEMIRDAEIAMRDDIK